jgi:hypothetical protein
MRNRFTSIIGSARRCWRRTKTTPIARPGEHRDDRGGAHARDRQLLEAVDQRQQRGDRQAGAREVEPAGVRVAVLGKHPRAQDEQRGHDRQGQQEDRSPPEQLEHDPAEHRTDGTPGAEAADPHADRDPPFSLVANMWKIRLRVEGASVAPAMPSSARRR